MLKVLTAVAAAIALAGCALAQGTMLTDDTARITSRANNTANRDRMIQDALAEAARLTRSKGYRYFVILEATDASRTANVAVLGQVTRNKANMTIPVGNLSIGIINRPGLNFLTSASRVEIVRPGLELTIRMYREGEIDPKNQGVWNAEAPIVVYPIMEPMPDPAPPARRRGPSTLRG